MPRIKEYTSQVGGPQELPLSQVSRQAFASDFNGAANGAVMAGRGLQETASDGVAIQRMLDDQKARKEVTDVAVELARFNSSAAHELKNAGTSGALDSESFTEEYMAASTPTWISWARNTRPQPAGRRGNGAPQR